MALPPAFLDELRARTPLPALIGRRMRLARSGRQWKGCCPFHGEKTPTFYVYDDASSTASAAALHGDAIGFVMRPGCRFPEAVRALAGEAGLEVPKTDAAGAPSGNAGAATCSASGRRPPAAFHRRLVLPEGAAGLRLSGAARPDRGDHPPLRPRLVRRGRGALAADLAPRGRSIPEQLVDAGLMRRARTGRSGWSNCSSTG